MNRNTILAIIVAVLLVVLGSATFFTGQRIDPQRPDAATPTPQSAPAQPSEPAAPGNSQPR